MINFFYEIDFEISNDNLIKNWLLEVAALEDKSILEINYIFCDDEYLLSLNQQFLDHDTLTDIISFDNCVGNELAGDIFISIERVRDNSKIFKTAFSNELNRIMVHGLLHFCGYKDKSKKEAKIMRAKEEEKLKLFHVEH